MISATRYEEALCVFRDLCEDLIETEGLSNEYVRGGVNLIADLFGVVGVPVDERMDEVLDDLKRIPMFTAPWKVHEYGVKYNRYNAG